MPSQQQHQQQQQQGATEHPQKSPFRSRSNSTSSYPTHPHPQTQTQTPLADADPASKRLRIAVIGSGLAGLTVAHLLSSLHTDQGHGHPGIDVHLFEKAQSLGMDTASLAVNCSCQTCAIAHDHQNGKGDDREQTPNATTTTTCNREHIHQGRRMDAPMRSFFPEYYPNLVRLYRSIGVKFREAENTLSCFNLDFSNSSNINTEKNLNAQTPPPKVQSPYLSSRSYKASLSSTVTLPDVPPFSLLNPFPFSRRVLGYCRIARDYLRILFVSKEFLSKGQMMDIGKHPIEWGNGRIISLREFLEGGGYSFEFAEFFVPLFACICTCSFERMMEYPACVVLEYVARCMPFGRMQVVESGVNDVTEALSENIRTVHYGTKIDHVLDGNSRKTTRRRARKEAAAGDDDADDDVRARETMKGSGPVVLVDSEGQEWAFDHVIFATQANQAAATLAGLQRRKRYDYDDNDEEEDSYDSDQQQESRFIATTTSANNNNNNNNNSPPSFDSIPPTHPFYQTIKTLSEFPYERTQVVVHTDTTSFLPKDRQDWRLLNIAKSSTADILASPINKISKELEHEMALRSKKAKSPRTSLFSLRVSSPLSKSNSRFRLPLSMSRRGSSQLGTTTSNSLRAHFEDLETSLRAKTKEPPTTASKRYNSAMVTHLLKDKDFTNDGTQVLQTTNPLFPPRPGTVIASAWFERPVVDPQSMRALDELQLRMDRQTSRRRHLCIRRYRRHRRTSSTATNSTRQSQDEEEEEGEVEDDDEDNQDDGVPVSDRVWFVGSYASPGIPLLEGCVVSAVQVMERIIASEPSFQLAPSVNAAPGSFLKMDANRRQARREREEKEEAKRKPKGRRRQQGKKSSTASSAYFANSWKDALWLDENEGPRGGGESKVWKSTNVFVEVTWMMLLYLVAIVQWGMVMVIESLGGNGSRWAHA